MRFLRSSESESTIHGYRSNSRDLGKWFPQLALELGLIQLHEFGDQVPLARSARTGSRKSRTTHQALSRDDALRNLCSSAYLNAAGEPIARAFASWIACLRRSRDKWVDAQSVSVRSGDVPGTDPIQLRWDSTTLTWLPMGPPYLRFTPTTLPRLTDQHHFPRQNQTNLP
jgi:hypothetical protein